MTDSSRHRSKYTKEQIAAINAKKRERAANKEKAPVKGRLVFIIHALGVLAAPLCLFLLSTYVVISTLTMVLIVAVLAVIGLFVQYPFFKKSGAITDNLKLWTPLYITYNIFGVGFMGLFVLLVLNQSLASDTIVQERHKIVGMDPEYQIKRWGAVVFLLENDVHADDVYLRAIDYNFWDRYQKNPDNTYIEYDFKPGLAGFNVKVAHRLIVDNTPNE